MRPLGGQSLGAHRAVADSDGTSELDEIASADRVVLLHERDEVVHGVVDTVVWPEVGLDGREEEHRAVGSTTTVHSKLISG